MITRTLTTKNCTCGTSTVLNELTHMVTGRLNTKNYACGSSTVLKKPGTGVRPLALRASDHQHKHFRTLHALAVFWSWSAEEPVIDADHQDLLRGRIVDALVRLHLPRPRKMRHLMRVDHRSCALDGRPLMCSFLFQWCQTAARTSGAAFLERTHGRPCRAKPRLHGICALRMCTPFFSMRGYLAPTQVSTKDLSL